MPETPWPNVASPAAMTALNLDIGKSPGMLPLPKRAPCKSSSTATALVEVCAHTSANDIPPDFVLVKLDGPKTNPRSISPTDLPPRPRNRLARKRGLGPRENPQRPRARNHKRSLQSRSPQRPTLPHRPRLHLPLRRPPQALKSPALTLKISRMLSAKRLSENLAARSCSLRGSILPSIRSKSTNARSNPASE